MPPLSLISTVTLLRGREKEGEKSMFHRPVGTFLAVSGEFGPGKEPSSGLVDCQIVPRAKHPRQFEELLPVGEFTTLECEPEKGTQLYPLIGPFYRPTN